MTVDIGSDGYRMTTAEIVFQTGELKDTQQTLIWQDFDTMPTMPRLRRFLDFWIRVAGGDLYSVTVTEIAIHTEPPHRLAALSFTLH